MHGGREVYWPAVTCARESRRAAQRRGGRPPQSPTVELESTSGGRISPHAEEPAGGGLALAAWRAAVDPRRPPRALRMFRSAAACRRGRRRARLPVVAMGVACTAPFPSEPGVLALARHLPARQPPTIMAVIANTPITHGLRNLHAVDQFVAGARTSWAAPEDPPARCSRELNGIVKRKFLAIPRHACQNR